MTTRTRGSDRRMGPPGSENWHAMLDAAESILREEGHAQLTSRRIAERIGVKQRLVYYYFRTMEALIVAMFRRSCERDLKRLHEVSLSPRPLSQMWEICLHSHDARLISEYMALANHIPDLKGEVIRFIEQSRHLQIAAITAAMARNPGSSRIKPAGLALLATSIGLLLNREEQLAISLGHREVFEIVTELLDHLER